MGEIGSGGIFVIGAAVAGACVMTARNAYKDYADRKRKYDLSWDVAADRPTYWGSLKNTVLDWKYVFAPEKTGNSY